MFQTFIIVVAAISLLVGLSTAQSIVYGKGSHYQYNYKDFFDFLGSGLLMSAAIFISITAVPSLIRWLFFV